MSQTLIRAKLMTTLAAWAEAHDPPLPLAREGQPFNKPDGGIFLEPFILPADTRVATLDGSRRRFFGSFQINVWAEDSKGAGAAEAVAEELSTLFPVFPKTLDPVSIEAPASIKKPLLDSGWRIVPVIIDYRLESEN